jgi:hypothetical protein
MELLRRGIAQRRFVELQVRGIRACVGVVVLALGQAVVVGNASPAHAQSLMNSSRVVCQMVNCYQGPVLGNGTSPGTFGSRATAGSGGGAPRAMPGAVTGMRRRYDPGPVQPLRIRGPSTLLTGQGASFRITFGATNGTGRPVLVMVEPGLTISSARGRGATCDYNQQVALCEQDGAAPFAVDVSVLGYTPGRYEIGAMGSAPTRITVPAPATTPGLGSPTDCFWTFCRARGSGLSVSEYPGFTREELVERAACVTTRTTFCGGGTPAPPGLEQDELECRDAESCSFPGIAFGFPLIRTVTVKDANADLHVALGRRTTNGVFPGDPIVFTGTIQNLGPDASPARKLSLRIPGNVQLKGFSNLRCQSDASPAVFVCDVVALGPPRGNGESRLAQSTRFGFTLLPSDPGRITVSAALERDRSDSHLANNFARASVNVHTPTEPLRGTAVTQTPGSSPPLTQTPGSLQPTSPSPTTTSTHPATTTTTHPATTTTTHELR